MIKPTKFTKKELKNIEKRFNELFGDNDCSGNYICNHETIDKHWVIYEDDLQVLKSYIAMTIYDIEKNSNLQGAVEKLKELEQLPNIYPEKIDGVYTHVEAIYKSAITDRIAELERGSDE